MRAALILFAASLALAGCGGGSSLPTKPTVVGPLTQDATGVWIFRPAGKPKRLVIFFHGQGGPAETTPVNHRAWIDHLVRKGAVVVYPRYELSYSPEILKPAVAGVRKASAQLGLKGVPVIALGYSRGAGLAVEYAAVAHRDRVPVPKVLEAVNPVPYGDENRKVGLRSLRPNTVIALLLSDHDPLSPQGPTQLLHRLRKAGFPGTQIRLAIVRSHGSFVADHLAPLGSTHAARAAYWAPTDQLFASLR